MAETIFLGVPVLESVKAKTVDCLLRLFMYCRNNPAFTLEYAMIIGSRQIHFARNALVRSALKIADYICFIDADMTFPPDIIHRLYFDSKDIVGVVYPGRVNPHPPNIFFYNKDKTNVEQIKKVPKDAPKLWECDGLGTGVMLIRKKVFEELPTPWFFYESGHSEDIMFCMKAREHGLKVFVDTTLNCGHVGDEEFRVK